MSALKSTCFEIVLDEDQAVSLRKRAEGFDDGEIKVILFKTEFEGKTIYGCWSPGEMIGNAASLEPTGEAALMALQSVPGTADILCCPLYTDPAPDRSTLEKLIRHIPNNSRIYFVGDIGQLFWVLMGMFNIEGEADSEKLSEWKVNLYQ